MNYATRDPVPSVRDPVRQSSGLSREFVVRSILKILDGATEKKGWGIITIQIQNGEIKTLRREGTISDERQVMM